MRLDGRDIKDDIECWCGLTSLPSHISSMPRRDGKRTVIYKCPKHHVSFMEINDKKEYIKKSKENTTKSRANAKSIKDSTNI